jgi:hypothetical protein
MARSDCPRYLSLLRISYAFDRVEAQAELLRLAIGRLAEAVHMLERASMEAVWAAQASEWQVRQLNRLSEKTAAKIDRDLLDYRRARLRY